MFGDPQVMPVKVIWDYTYYWGVLCQLFFQRRLTDLANIGRLSEQLNHSRALNQAMQDFMREWSKLSDRRNDAVLLDQAALPWFAELNRGLRDQLDDESFRARMIEYTALLDSLATEIVDRACEQQPSLDGSEVRKLLSAIPATTVESLLFTQAAA
jgi:hypothetical protein